MKLAEYLATKQLDESAFAAALGVSAMGVRHWVNGRRTPRPEQMQKIFSATDGAVTPNDFLPMRAAE